MDRILTVGIIQQSNGADVADNRNRLVAKIRELAADGAQLVVLQELHDSRYFCQEENVADFDLAEPIPGEPCRIYGEVAKECGIVLVTSQFERRAPGIYHNTAVVFESDGSIAGKYRKMHIPDDPAYYEKFYFTPGDLGFEPIDTSVGRLGVLDSDAEQGRQQEAWTTVQRGHAVANGLPVVAVNRVGHEPDPSGRTEGITFWGHSFVAGPQGEILYMAPSDAETTAIVDIDMTRSEHVRRWWPFLRDRRIDAYSDILKRYID